MKSKSASSPKYSLFYRLSYPQKFILISLIFVLAFLGVIPLVTEMVTRINQYGYTELQGAEYLRPVQQLLVDVQTHQIALHEYLDGGSTYTEVETAQTLVDEDLRALAEVQTQYGEKFGVQNDFQTIQNHWASLSTTTRQITDEESNSQHQALLQLIQGLIKKVGDSSFLILDPDLDTYYMMDTAVSEQPAVQEQLNTLFTSAGSFIHATAVSENEKLFLGTSINQLTRLNENIQSNIATSLANDASGQMQALVQVPLAAALAANQDVISEIETQLNQETNTPDFEAILLSKIITAQDANQTLYKAVSQALEIGIQARITRYTNRLLTVGVTALIGLSLAFLFGVSLMHTISRPLISLIDATQKLAQGEVSVRVPVTTIDEVGKVALAFNQMAQEVEASRIQLETRVDDRTRDLELAAEIGRNLSTVRDLKTLLQQAVDVIQTRFNLYYAQIYLTDSTGFNLVIQAGTGTVGTQLVQRGHTLPIGPGSINGTAGMNLTPVVVADTAQSLSFLPNPLLPETRSEAAIPLVIEDRLVGVLNLQASVPNTLTQENLSGFEALAGQLAIAIENATLFQEVSLARTALESQFKNQNQEGWETFFDGTTQKDQLGYAFQGNEFMPLSTDEPLPVSDPASVLTKPITFFEENLGEIHVSFDDPSALAQAEKVIEAVAHQVSQQINNLRLISQSQKYQVEAETAVRKLTREAWQDYLDSLGLNGYGYLYDQQEIKPVGQKPALNGSAIEHPILFQGTQVGELVFDGVAQWDEGTQQLVDSVSKQLSAHLENIRLYEESERRGLQLETRSKELEASQRVTFAASEVTQLEDLFHQVVNLIRDQFDLYHVQVYLVDEEKQAAVLRESTGYAGTQLLQRGHHIPLNNTSLVTKAIRTGEPVLVADTSIEESFLANPLLPYTVSELALPLKANNRSLGTLDLQSRRLGQFTPETVNLFRQVADQISLIIERTNARVTLENLLSLQKATFESTADGILVQDLAGKIVSFNKKFLELWELAEEEINVNDPVEALNVIVEKVADSTAFIARVQELYDQPDAISESDNIVLKDDRIFERFSMPQRTEDGKIIGRVWSFRDVTERKINEEALRVSEARLSEAMNIARLGNWEYDVEQDLFTFNDTFYTIFQTTAQEVGGYQLSSGEYAARFVHPEDAAVVGAEIGTALSSTERYYTNALEHRVLFENKRVGHVAVKFTVERDENGKVTRFYGANQDITERKQAEITIRENQEFLQAVMNNIPESIFWKDENLTYLGCNTAFAKDAGLASPDEIVGKNDWDMPWKEQAELYRADDFLVMEKKESKLDYEEPQTTPDGTTIWLRTSKVPLKDAANKVYAVLGMYADITERKKAEETIRANQEFLQAVMNNIPESIFWKDENLTYLGCNTAFAKDAGLASPDEIVGKNDWDMPWKEQAELYRADDFLVMEKKESKLDYEEPQTTPDGSTIWLRTSKVPLKDADEKVYAVLGMYADVTERKKAEETIRENQEFLQAVMNNIPESIFWKDENLTYLGCNTAFAKDAGLASPDDIVGKNDWDMPWKEQAELYRADDFLVMEKKESKLDYEEPQTTPDGSTIWLRTSKVPLKDAEDKVYAVLGMYADITERKKAEETIRENQEFLQAVMNNIPESIFWKDENLTYLGCNTAFANDAGLASPDDIVGKNDWDMPWKEQAELYRADDFLVMEKKESKLDYEEPQTTPDGSTIWLRTSKVPLKDADDKVYAVLGMYADITERKKAEDALRESLATRETLYAGSSRIVRANNMEEVLFGLVGSTSLQTLDRTSLLLFNEPWREKRPEALFVIAMWENSDKPSPMPVGTRYPLELMPIARQMDLDTPSLIQDIQTDKRVDPYTRTVFEKLGTKSVLFVPIIVGGDFIGVIAAQSKSTINISQEELRQITSLVAQAAAVIQNHRLYDEALRRATELETVAELGTIATSQTQISELLHTVAEQTQNRFGLFHVDIYLREERTGNLRLTASTGEIGQHMLAEELQLQEDDTTSLVAVTAKTRKGLICNPVSLKTEFITHELLSGASSAMGIPLLSGERVLGVLAIYDTQANRFKHEDIHITSVLAAQIVAAYENARLITEIQEAARRLKELDKLKSEFLANMSHELRTPLNSVIGYSEVLLMGIDGEMTPEAQTDVQAIYDNGRHLLSLINDVLDLAKIEAGRISLNKKKENILKLFEQAKTNNIGLLHKLKKPIEIRAEVAPNLPAISVDATRMVQIIGNLISNAIKYSDKGTITLRGYSDEEWLAIEVEDEGIGIAPEDLDKVFDQFTQLDMSSTRKVEGTGLGLSITRHLVEMHGGSINVESTLGMGSKFTVRLPVHEANGHHQN